MIYNHKILISVPSTDAKGGISNYFQSLRKYLPENIYYLNRGARNWPNQQNILVEIWRGIKDIINFISFLRTEKIQLIQTNTSLSSKAVFRDGLFVIISKIMNKKVIVFFHGWDHNFINGTDGIKQKLFKFIFFKADAIIDLTKKNRNKLIEWGYTKKVYVETTVVADIFQDIEIDDILNRKYDSNLKSINILFLARVEKTKGIYEAIDAFAAINKDQVECKLIVAGDGKELENVLRYVTENRISNIEFKGFVTGEKKLEAFLNAHIYLFPSYSEGMPTTILEALACGLPILTTPVGGIPDIFETGKNGYFIDIKNIPDITEKLISLSQDKKRMKEISYTNFDYAQKRFSVHKIASRIIGIFEEILDS